MAAGDQVWEVDLSGNRMDGSPCIFTDGAVSIQAVGGDVYTVEPDGSVRWNFFVGGSTDSMVNGIAFDDSGNLYTGSAGDDIYGFNSETGDVLGTFTTRGGAADDTSPAIYDDGSFVIGADDNYIYRFDQSVNVIWEYETGNDINCAPGMTQDQVSYWPSSDGTLYALDADGNLVWSYDSYSTRYSFGSPAITADESQMVVGEDSNQNNAHIVSLDPSDGSEQWAYDTGFSGSDSDPRRPYAMALDEQRDRVYFNLGGESDGSGLPSGLVALSLSSGSFQWEYDLGTNVESSPTIDANGRIYIPDGSGNLHAVNPDGSKYWEYTAGAGGRLVSSPAIDSELGRVYYGTPDGSLHAVETDAQALYTLEDALQYPYYFTIHRNNSGVFRTNLAILFSDTLGLRGGASSPGSNVVMYSDRLAREERTETSGEDAILWKDDEIAQS